ncbi:hypothetical protein DEH79_03540 [Mycoplasmopsis synoviae]|nr:Type III restriction-modification system methylation subunit [Mycoplasmopsis synoviae]AQU48233.1 Type III restriction-modification system methylation subunit [Mycoplasmopsis synoviae]AWL84444.1 hypothetical protein MSH_03550 [Mycoplasmopsis synoviae]QLE14159.1 hypothetical protein DEH79_03540 [Mycoplasmopsis synoviae]
MVNKRFNLAKDLLNEAGLFFNLIDDNQHAYLKVLMDEIFGEENFIASCPRKKLPFSRKNADKKLIELHDYVLIYIKNKNIIKLKKEKRGNPKIHKDENGKYQLTSFKNTWFNENNYPIYYDNKNKTFHSESNSNNDLKEFLGNWIWKKDKF